MQLGMSAPELDRTLDAVFPLWNREHIDDVQFTMAQAFREHRWPRPVDARSTSLEVR